VRSYVDFSHTITLGDFAEGWTFPAEYFWKTEGLLAIVWLLALGAALSGGLRRRRNYFWFWSILLLATYGGLGFACVVLHKFVLYGRTARCLTPLFALICGGCAAEAICLLRFGTAARAVLAAIVIAIACPHFYAALTQWYPERFKTQARQIMSAQRQDPRLRLVNAWFYRSPEWVASVPLVTTTWERPHPMQYEPFLYENQTPAERRAYRAKDMTMRVGQIAVTATQPNAMEYAGYSGPVRLRVRLPTNHDPRPLITTGAIGVADGLYLKRTEPGRFQVGFDHWGRNHLISSVIALDEKVEHTIDASLGSLLPPDDEYYRTHPAVAPLRGQLWVAVDGKIVFDQPAEFFPAKAGQVDFGLNLVEMAAIPVFGEGFKDPQPLPLSALAPR